MGPTLFVHNENSAYIMPCVTTHAVTSCAHHAVHACRQAGHPMYMWHARNYLWTCHSLSQMIFIKINPKYENCKPEHAEKDSHSHAQQEQG